MKENNMIPIVMICDKNYVVPTCVALTSIILNKNKDTYLSVLDKKYFYEFESEKIKVTIIEGDMKKLENLHRHKAKNNYCVATEAALLKFEIPYLIADYNKIIYLDGDIICRKDLSGLYNTKLTTQYAAVVMDSGKLYSHRQLVIESPKYFNSGVMLLNLEKMRLENITEELIKTKREMQDRSLMDQNVLNIVFGMNTKLLPIKYNFLYINLLRAEHQNNFTMCELNEMYGTKYDSLDSIRKDSVIIHFSSKDKPWKYYDVRLADEWFGYFMKSPVKYIQLKRKSLAEEELREKVKKQNQEIRNLKKQIVNKDEIIDQLSYHIDEIWKSKSLKIGRTITILPRCLRESLEIIRKRREILRYQLPEGEVLNKSRRQVPIIVSLTTYSTRINTVGITIASIMRQTIKPDKIFLYLDKNEFNSGNIPTILKKQQKLGLDIFYCDDLKSHKKYYYAMKSNPDAIIITVDDDIEYQEDLLEKLLDSYNLFPKCISAMRAHRMKLDKDDKLCSYSQWKQRDKSQVFVPAMDLFPTGCGGVLYPPSILNKEVFNKEAFMKLCLYGDDIWLKAMAMKNNVKTVLADRQEPLKYIDGTQDIGLFNQNVVNNKNDEMIKAVIEKYFDEKEFVRLLKENDKNNEEVS